MAVTKDESIVAVEFHYGTCQKHIGLRGGQTLHQIRFRRNGKTKTWITRPEEFSVPVKRGLREYGYLTQTNAKDFHTAEQCEIVITWEKDEYMFPSPKAVPFSPTSGGWFPNRK
jgi:hypothetical protein